MPILGVVASGISGHLWPSSSYESISTVTVGAGGSSTVTFSSIPSTYTHLQIRGFANTGNGTGGSTATILRLNSDSGSNYAFHFITADGTSVSGGGTTSTTGITFNSASQSTYFSGQIIDILDYANTNKYKTTKILNGFDLNGAGAIALRSGLWQSTTAVSTITITATLFPQYSSFALYGIKVAA
jgi:hypothetical protein